MFRCRRILCRPARALYHYIKVLHLPKRLPQLGLPNFVGLRKLFLALGRPLNDLRGPVLVYESPLHTLESPVWLKRPLCLTEKIVYWPERVLCRSGQVLCCPDRALCRLERPQMALCWLDRALRRTEMALRRTEMTLWFYQVLLVHTSLLSCNFIFGFEFIKLFALPFLRER